MATPLPPGHKGMTPTLAMVYTSSAGPSPFGFGWGLPIGRIERNGKWGVPRCSGPYTNEFVLTLPSGTLELANDPPGSNEYRPRFDEGYLKATRAGNTWAVFDRGGMKYTFGAQVHQRTGTDTTQFMTTDASGYCRFTTSWALNRIEDTHGNRIDVEWAAISNVLYPLFVDYGGTATIAHPYRVAFTYELRPDIVTSSAGGAPAEMLMRVETIAVSTTQGTLPAVRSYTLAYDADDENEGYQSRLNRVDISGNPWPQQFAYATSYNGNLGWHGQPQTIDRPSDHTALRASDDGEMRRTLLDMTGDGIVDLVNISSGSPWLVNPGYLNEDGTPGGFRFQSNTWGVSQVPPNRFLAPSTTATYPDRATPGC